MIHKRNEKLMNYLGVILAVSIGFTCLIASAQKIDPLNKRKTEPEKKVPDKWNLLIYVRVIRDAAGNVRFDENFVPNIRLNKNFNLELGIRHGEQTFADQSTTQYGAYNHYKIELQTKRVKTFRLWTRLSDNIVRSPDPQYSRSNYIIGIDGKPKISKSFTAIVAYGYVWSVQQTNQLEAPPITNGTKSNYPIFKIGLQYNLWGKGHIEYTWGSYDVFNPYLLRDPFTQISFDYELGKRIDLYTYFRREYLNNYDLLFNDFFTGGVRIHFGKK